MKREELTRDELVALQTASDSVPLPQATAKPSGNRRQDQALVDLHLQFSDILSDTLTAMTHRPVKATMRDEWLGTYAEFVFAQSVPTCCAVVVSKLHDLEFFVVMDPRILFPLLDRLLGSRTVEPVPQRPLSEIEQTVARLLIEEIVSRYAAAWQHSLALELSVDRIEHNVQQMAGLRGNEYAYISRYELACDGEFGLLEMCLPWGATEKMRKRLAL